MVKFPPPLGTDCPSPLPSPPSPPSPLPVSVGPGHRRYLFSPSPSPSPPFTPSSRASSPETALLRWAPPTEPPAEPPPFSLDKSCREGPSSPRDWAPSLKDCLKWLLLRCCCFCCPSLSREDGDERWYPYSAVELNSRVVCRQVPLGKQGWED
ncbi:hypothetical protein Taro_046678 [Colocasia esculenta]|uniref:Uncharacterized protein n=1 Tax=Colocasia esculenta TaxID=4460 RepID=A0A843WZL6_COLES|nr:hypothetical protein [Colocasia esculenta]